MTSAAGVLYEVRDGAYIRGADEPWSAITATDIDDSGEWPVNELEGGGFRVLGCFDVSFGADAEDTVW